MKINKYRTNLEAAGPLSRAIAFTISPDAGIAGRAAKEIAKAIFTLARRAGRPPDAAAAEVRNLAEQDVARHLKTLADRNANQDERGARMRHHHAEAIRQLAGAISSVMNEQPEHALKAAAFALANTRIADAIRADPHLAKRSTKAPSEETAR